LRRTNEVEQVKLVDVVRDRINVGRKVEQRIPDKKPLHFRDLKHEQRKFYAKCISQAELKTICVLIHKSSLPLDQFRGKSKLYAYGVRLLLERISWYCRDSLLSNDEGDGSVELVFSNRHAMSNVVLREYVEGLEAEIGTEAFHATAGVIRSDQIAAYTPGRRMGLQIADAVASSYYFAVEPSEYGLTEEGYARLLLANAYHHEGENWGYGIQIMPGEADMKRQRGELLADWK
jgi:hypothetical protein